MKTETIHLLAGQKNNAELIYENVLAEPIGDNCYKLLSAPVFAKGAAKFDVIRLLSAGLFEVEQRSGNLSLRVLAKHDIDAIKAALLQELKPLEAQLDFDNERILVFSIAIEKGFDAIEQSFNKVLAERDDAIWLYANVYEKDGQTPLNWWHDYLAK